MKKVNLLLLLVILLTACVNENTTPPETIGEWKLVWNDEFNEGELPDPMNWSYDTGSRGGWGNAEKQTYLADPETAFIDNGLLHIVAYKSPRNNWLSARMKTAGTAEWLYGRFEIRAQLPEGVGTWPAIWMLPSKDIYGEWPKSGEIDIMEHVGFNQNQVHQTVHTGSYNHRINTHKGEHLIVDRASKEFYVYAIEWEEDEIRWYIDDEEVFVFKNENNTYMEWPFDHHYYLILNIAMGGSWGGIEGIDSKLENAEMLIDYVRVYQKDGHSMITPLEN